MNSLFDRLVFVQPIFAPDEHQYCRNLDSILSVAAYQSLFGERFRVALGGWMPSDSHWKIFSKVVRETFGARLLSLVRLSKNYGKAHVVNRLSSKIFHMYPDLDLMLTADSDIVFNTVPHLLVTRFVRIMDSCYTYGGMPIGLLAADLVEDNIHKLGPDITVIFGEGLEKRSDLPSEETLVRDAEPSGIAGNCFLIRKDVWQRVGGYKERFVYAGDDAKLLVDLHKAGYSSFVARGCSVVHPYDSDKDYTEWKIRVHDNIELHVKEKGTIPSLEQTMEDADEFWESRE